MRSRSLFLLSLVGGVLFLPGPAHRLSTAECAVAKVVDGDTFYCRGGTKVRLTPPSAARGMPASAPGRP